MEALLSVLDAGGRDYTYPRFHLKIGRGELDLYGEAKAEFIADRGRTDIELDQYHWNLLHDTNPLYRLVGVASIIYWGFATFGDEYARVRVRKFIRDNNIRLVDESLKLAITSAERGNLGIALAHMGQLRGLGRTPFASKVVAFAFPDRAGVYDNRIQRGLEEHQLFQRPAQRALFVRCLGGVGSVRRSTIQERYSAWCDALSQIAARTKSKTRPLDIERAIFALMGTD